MVLGMGGAKGDVIMSGRWRSQVMGGGEGRVRVCGVRVGVMCEGDG